jgi:hypothetical protein
MVWLTSVLMVTEACKVLLGLGKISKAPKYSMYDPYFNRIPDNEK